MGTWSGQGLAPWGAVWTETRWSLEKGGATWEPVERQEEILAVGESGEPWGGGRSRLCCTLAPGKWTQMCPQDFAANRRPWDWWEECEQVRGVEMKVHRCCFACHVASWLSTRACRWLFSLSWMTRGKDTGRKPRCV